MKKDCTNCINCIMYEYEDITWCDRYDCLTEEVAKEKEPSCWETIAEKYERRFAICWECKNFKTAYPLTPNKGNLCKKGIPIPIGEASKNCIYFKAIDKIKKL